MSNIYFIDEAEAVDYYFSINNVFPINMREYEKMLEDNVPERCTSNGRYYYEVKEGEQP